MYRYNKSFQNVIINNLFCRKKFSLTKFGLIWSWEKIMMKYYHYIQLLFDCQKNYPCLLLWAEYIQISTKLYHSHCFMLTVGESEFKEMCLYVNQTGSPGEQLREIRSDPDSDKLHSCLMYTNTEPWRPHAELTGCRRLSDCYRWPCFVQSAVWGH